MDDTSCPSWPRWRCRGRCSPRSCAGSTACEGLPLPRPDGSEAMRPAEPRESRVPRSASTAKPARTGLRTVVQRLSSAETCRRTHPPVDQGPTGEQALGYQPSPSGECRIRAPRIYRGKDIQWWMDAAGVLDQRYDEVDDIARARKVPSL